MNTMYAICVRRCFTKKYNLKMNLYCFLPLLAAINFAQGKQHKCDKKIDLAIVLDASASIGKENFNLAKDFAKKLTKRFAVSKDRVRVSVVSYSQYIKILAKFSDYYNEKTIDNTLDKAFYEAAATNTGKTLEAVNFEVFSAKAGSRSGRPDVKTVTIIVTDGNSGHGSEFVRDKADLMKNRGIEMFVVGITNRMEDEELNVLSSEPVKHHLFRLTDSTAVKQIVDSIVKQVCK